MEALQDCVSRSLSSDVVAQKIWAVEANQRCADCGAPHPDWASVNLCVVLCKCCAGTEEPCLDGSPNSESEWSRALISFYSDQITHSVTHTTLTLSHKNTHTSTYTTFTHTHTHTQADITQTHTHTRSHTHTHTHTHFYANYILLLLCSPFYSYYYLS